MFDLVRTAQAAAYLLRKHGGRLNCKKLVKLMYLADRKAIDEHCIPITGDGYRAMAAGPVLERLSALMQGEAAPELQGRWDALFKREGDDVSCLKELPRDWLSDFELDILDETCSRFGGMSAGELSEWTHNPENCPEWKAPQGEGEPIELEDIMRALGFDEKAIESAQEDLALYEEAQKSWELLRESE